MLESQVWGSQSMAKLKLFKAQVVEMRFIFNLRGIGVYTLILISNGDFAPLFWTLWIYPCYLKLKTQFAPTPWSSFNGVNLVAKRPSCPCNFAPTCFLNLCFYPYFITHNTTGLSKQYTHVWKGFSHKIKTEMSCIYLETLRNGQIC